MILFVVFVSFALSFSLDAHHSPSFLLSSPSLQQRFRSVLADDLQMNLLNMLGTRGGSGDACLKEILG